ncbi:hypothetical protein BCR44DRAFT_1429409 [Catenaria anguillulae PL171]|uniref:Uncharacterized protein n=1 Tax=Catenaria anguillulae PL171 TaxID=765915 RepID=A0A1Y2HTU6_9FUNG|nr:hypothetical protein BCR44DRAFT_1429409 [Catenaria anguillulae PL171]
MSGSLADLITDWSHRAALAVALAAPSLHWTLHSVRLSPNGPRPSSFPASETHQTQYSRAPHHALPRHACLHLRPCQPPQACPLPFRVLRGQWRQASHAMRTVRAATSRHTRLGVQIHVRGSRHVSTEGVARVWPLALARQEQGRECPT